MLNISLKEARELICKNVRAGEPEKISLYKALGRIAFRDVYAEKDLPSIRQAAQDGFAVAEIKKEGGFYQIASQLGSTGALAKDEALPVETGQKVPENALAVIPREDVDIEGGFIKVKKEPQRNNFLKMPGEDFKKGERLIKKGDLLNPGRISLLAAYGYKEVEVYKKPRAGIITLNPYISSPSPAVIDSNSYLLAALVEKEGGEVVRIEHAGNKSPAELMDLISNLKIEADIVIATGATFGGKNRDLASFIKDTGGKILFSGVKMQPGGHNGAVIFDDLLFLSLSGNPAACAVGFHLLASPFLRLYQGKSPHLTRIKARVDDDFPFSARGSYRFLRGHFYFAGEVRVRILPGQKPGMIRSLLDYNCLLEISPETETIRAGMEVDVILV
ncbi:molybdopterin molybdotransferase [Thermosyntropha lipolytica DSM 11003]|uniref:Molybdopterin molybdenumtransferase n=1 Tax=Thermosyntropha lipolytica DSM 11003 TaxID=1123382 RepID=A0A1M5RPY5_9FIRM|nr:molybdopterin molybdotransferase MoeA [Thermosyntropha lipolytica]SHH28201.1 molybdopterin molybdotransferase [Thermosyntropha lipolytica DSM 11003]